MDELTSIDRNLQAPLLPGGLDTPAVVVDLDRVDANIDRMQQLLDTRDVDLRPHAKTHKSPYFAKLQLAAGAVGITVAVLGEAEVMADAGIEDSFVAYPVWAVGEKARRVHELAGRVRLAVGVDSVEGARQLGRVRSTVEAHDPMCSSRSTRASDGPARTPIGSSRSSSAVSSRTVATRTADLTGSPRRRPMRSRP